MAESKIESNDLVSWNDLKLAILGLFKFFFTCLAFIKSAIKKNIIALLIFSIVGGLFGYSYYLLHPPYYEAEMIVQYNDLNKKTYYEIIAGLNNLLISRSYSKFSTELGISEKTAHHVNNLEAMSINNVTLKEDTSSKVGQPFKILARMKTNDIIDTMQEAIFDYLRNNPYLKRLKEGQKRIQEDMLSFIDKEQKNLDTLKANYSQTLATLKMPSTFYNNAINPADLYQQSLTLAYQKEATLRWLNNESEAVMLISPFKKTETPKKTTLKIPLLIGLASGFLLGLIISAIAELKRKAFTK